MFLWLFQASNIINNCEDRLKKLFIAEMRCLDLFINAQKPTMRNSWLIIFHSNQQQSVIYTRRFITKTSSGLV